MSEQTSVEDLKLNPYGYLDLPVEKEPSGDCDCYKICKCIDCSTDDCGYGYCGCPEKGSGFFPDTTCVCREGKEIKDDNCPCKMNIYYSDVEEEPTVNRTCPCCLHYFWGWRKKCFIRFDGKFDDIDDGDSHLRGVLRRLLLYGEEICIVYRECQRFALWFIRDSPVSYMVKPIPYNESIEDDYDYCFEMERGYDTYTYLVIDEVEKLYNYDPNLSMLFTIHGKKSATKIVSNDSSLDE